jgi:hypothetical protein
MTRGDINFIAAIVIICAVTVWIGVPPQRLFEHDIFFLLDNGYRVAQGQVPNRDFSSAWGPVMFVIEATGLKLSNLRPEGVAYANALFGTLLALWAYRVSRNRLAGIYTLLLIVAPFAIGWGALNYTYGMLYNRYGYALLGIVVLECATGEFGISTGAACVLLASLKMSYAVAAMPFVLFSWPFRKQRLLGLVIGGGIAGLLVLAYLRFDVLDFYRDLHMAAQSKAWNFREMLRVGFAPVALAESIPLMILGVLAGRARSILLAALTFLTGTFVLATNHQFAGHPLVGFAALAIVSHASLAPTKDRRPIAVALAAICLAPVMLQSAISLGGATIEKQGSGITFEPVAQVVTTDTGGPAYQVVLADGISLLIRHTGSQDGVLAMDMLNPFNYLLRRPSPLGGMASATWNYQFSEQAHIPPDIYFGNARFVMQRKYDPKAGDYAIENPNIAGLEQLYGPTLLQRYRLIEETSHWRLYDLNVPAGSR